VTRHVVLLAAPSLVLVLVAGTARPGTQTPPTFRAEVDAVYVDVFVTSRGEPVRGLGAGDFEVTDNGVKQEVTLVQLETVGITTLLLFDMSGSVKGARLADLKAAGHAFLDGLDERDEGALMAFSHQLLLKSDATSDRATLHEALERLVPGGATALYDALYVALKLPLGRGRPLIVLFTDGEDNVSWLGRDEVKEAILQSTALLQVVVTGSRDEPGGAFLREMAEATGGRAWNAATSKGLRQRFLDILSAMRTRYLLTYEPRGVKPTGRHHLKVAVRGRKVDVRHRRDYLVNERP
jgi:Ca-activated chloride channel family protein